ncbi:DUF5777 family beta-barrel protein [Tenacibaculum sp. C7A-26P2]|uniref:DUF5777 family beta-barrel protein n=1 Tax=Tenacibaculum sp. C7A-26P2 TaxID=3447504 RepID=UPI003F87836B
MKVTKLILLLLFPSFLIAQDLLNQLDKEFPSTPVYEIATFKTTRIGLGHSIETRKQGALEISLYNRFWNHKEGTTQRFLADEVSTRFGLDYAITNNFTMGVSYTNFDKITEGYLKYKFLKQLKKSKKIPLSMVLLQTISHRNKEALQEYDQYGVLTSDSNKSSVYSYTLQLLIARKFNTKFSAQFSPIFITRNHSVFEGQPKNQFALGFGARYKVGGHVSFVSEYYKVFNTSKIVTSYNPFMIGVNWELSHLLLQFQITNVRNYADDTFITQTKNNFNFHDGNFHFGFNATFVLHLSKNEMRSNYKKKQ